MSEIKKNMYLDFGGLQKYDELIKVFIANKNSVLSNAIAALDAKLGEFEGSDDMTVASILEDIKGSIVSLVAKDAELDAKDVELEGKIAEEIGKIVGVLGEGESHMTLVEIAAQLKSLGDSVSTNTEDISKITERVAAVEKSIADLGEIEGGENLGSVVSKVNSNYEAIATLKGEEDVVGSVKNTAKSYADAAQSAAEATAAADATSKADAAEAAAKEYADGLVNDADGNAKFDEKGAAAAAQAAAATDAQTKANAAQSAAEAYADSLATNYDAAGAASTAESNAKGYADLLDTAMDERVKVLEAIDHEQLAADAVAAVVAGAESDFDTLKEVADWIASDKEGSAALQTTVSGHTESINTINSDIDALETKVDNDIANLTTHMSEAATALAEVDGRLDVLEAFEETHASIEISSIEGLFNTQA